MSDMTGITGGTDVRSRPTRPAPTADAHPRAPSKVTMRFGGLVANKDVDFVIPRGAIVSLIGPNGAGKTTFFNQLTGMLEPTSGDIVFDGDLAARARRRTRSPSSASAARSRTSGSSAP